MTGPSSTPEDMNSSSKEVNPVFLQKEGQEDLSGSEIFSLSSSNIFNRDHHRIYIRIHQTVFDKVLEDGANGVDSGYGLVDEFALGEHVVHNVGIRVRGNTSAANIKRQFKFKFDIEYAFAWRENGITRVDFPDQDDRRFFGLHGFSVRASQNDPSRIREMLAGKVFREAALGPQDPQRSWRNLGGLVYRTAFATLYVTNGRTEQEGYDHSNPGYRVPHRGLLYDPKGLYVITENIDKTYIQTRFERYPREKIKGYLFQADKAAAYFKESEYSRTGWKLKMAKGKKPKDEEDRAKGDEKMIDLIRFLKSNPLDEDIRQIFDMDSVNAYVAGALLATHWDSLAANRNNDFMFYLKRDILDEEMKPVLDDEGKEKEEKRWYIITWDLDNTLWDKPNESSDVRNPYRNWFSNYIYQPAEKDSRKTRLLDVVYDETHEEIRQKYKSLLNDLLEGYYSQTSYEKKVDELSRRVERAIEDTRREVSQAGWQKDWGEKHNDRDFEDIKDHARVRRHKVGSQVR